MAQSALRASVFVLFAVVSLVWSGPEAKPPARTAETKEKAPDPAREVRVKLARPISLPQGIGGNTPLKDALEHLTDRQDVPIILDPMVPQLGQALGVGDIADRPVKLPKLQNVPLRTVLDMLAAQTDSAYLVKPGYVEFTLPQRANPIAWLPPNSRQDAVIPKVHLDVERRSLDQALRDMADATGISIVLDPRAGDSSKTLVTITLTNVPIDTAVSVVADLSGLKMVALDHVLYVTSPANAKVLSAEQAVLRGVDPGM
jgi:hypothetical protein